MQTFRGRQDLVQQFYEASNALPEPITYNSKVTVLHHYLDKDERLKPSRLFEILENDDESTITIKTMYTIMGCVKSRASNIGLFLPFFEHVVGLDKELYSNLSILKDAVHRDSISLIESSRASKDSIDNAFQKMNFTTVIPEWKLITFMLFSKVCYYGFGNDFLEKSTEGGNILQNVPLFQMVILEYFHRKKASHLSQYKDCYWINHSEYLVLGQILDFFSQFIFWIDSIDVDSDEFISTLKSEQQQVVKMLIKKLIIVAYEVSEVFDLKFDDIKYLSNVGTNLVSNLCSSYFESVQSVLLCLGNDYGLVQEKRNAKILHDGKTVGLVKQKIINISGSVIQSLFFSNLLDPFFNTRQIVETVLRSFVDPYLKLLLFELQKEEESVEDVLIKETACRSAGYYSAIFGKLLYQVSLNVNNQFGDYLDHIQFLKNFNDEIIDIMVFNLKDNNLNVRKTTCISLSNFLSSREIRPSVFSLIVEYFRFNLDNFRAYSNLISVIVKFLHRDNFRDVATLQIANKFLTKLCTYIKNYNSDFKEWKVITTCVYYVGHDISKSILRDFLILTKNNIKNFLEKRRLPGCFLPILCSFLKTAHANTIELFEELDLFKDLKDLLNTFAICIDFNESFFKLIDGMFMANIFKNLNLIQETSGEMGMVQEFIAPFLEKYLHEKILMIESSEISNPYDLCVPCLVSFGRLVEYFVIESPNTDWISSWAAKSIRTMVHMLEKTTSLREGPLILNEAKANLRVEVIRCLILLSHISIHEVAQLFKENVDDFFLFDDIPDRFDSCMIESGFLRLLEYSIDHLELDLRLNFGDLLQRIDDYLFGEVFSRRSCVLNSHWKRVMEKLRL